MSFSPPFGHELLAGDLGERAVRADHQLGLHLGQLTIGRPILNVG